jgi:hypothetical protein
MDKDIQKRKESASLKWIKAKSGTTYLCPVEKLAKLKDPSEADLKKICVDESDNPQND